MAGQNPAPAGRGRSEEDIRIRRLQQPDGKERKERAEELTAGGWLSRLYGDLPKAQPESETLQLEMWFTKLATSLYGRGLVHVRLGSWRPFMSQIR